MSATSGNQHLSTDSAVTLFVPGLLANTSAPALLTRLLARADRLNGRLESTAQLFALFGIERETGCDLPVASVARIADMGVIDNDWWIRADPVYMEARRDSLVLHAGIGLSKDESDRLVTELNESLALDGWLLRAPSPDRWYLKPLDGTDILTTPLSEVAGQNIHPLLPQGPDRQAWLSRLTEFQILLHTSSVNAAREAQGALPANSVWFWGGGRLPRVPAGLWGQVVAEDALSLGLARLAGIPVRPLPAGGAELPAIAGTGPILVVLDSLVPSSPDGITRFCELWLEPLLEAVHRQVIGHLVLATDYGPRFHYTRGHRWRIWRRGRTPSAWREHAA